LSHDTALPICSELVSLTTDQFNVIAVWFGDRNGFAEWFGDRNGSAEVRYALRP